MWSRIKFLLNILAAGFSAGALTAALVVGVSSIVWLLGAPVLAGALAMAMSAYLLMGFGGLSGGATVVVGLSWAFADRILAMLGITGTAAIVTMCIAYFLLGLTQGKKRKEVVAEALPLTIGIILGIIIAAFVAPQAVAGGIIESILSVTMVAAARSAKGYIADRKALRN